MISQFVIDTGDRPSFGKIPYIYKSATGYQKDIGPVVGFFVIGRKMNEIYAFFVGIFTAFLIGIQFVIILSP